MVTTITIKFNKLSIVWKHQHEDYVTVMSLLFRWYHRFLLKEHFIVNTDKTLRLQHRMLHSFRIAICSQIKLG